MIKTYLLILAVSFSVLSADDSQAVLTRLNDYQEAYQTKDVNKIASFWSEDAEFTYPRTGETIKGNKTIAEALLKKFNEVPNSKFIFKDLDVKFKDKDHAVVRGYTQLDQNGKLTERYARKIELVNQEGQWVISDVDEIDIANAPDVYEHLKGLDWLVGNWNDDDDNVDIHFENKWDSNKNFLIQKFSSKIYGSDEIDGLQIIGWDPNLQKIRSWVFDTDGGYGGGYWSREGDSWQLQMNYTLSDGRQAGSLNIFTPKDANNYEFKSVQREVDGNVLPDIDTVKIVREKS